MGAILEIFTHPAGSGVVFKPAFKGFSLNLAWGNPGITHLCLSEIASVVTRGGGVGHDQGAFIIIEKKATLGTVLSSGPVLRMDYGVKFILHLRVEHEEIL